MFYIGRHRHLIDNRARNRLSKVVTPLLQLISKYTGLTSLTLIGGARPEASVGPNADYLVASVHYGKTDEPSPRDFPTYDPIAFRRNFLGSYAKYLSRTKGQLKNSRL